jgi:multiple sugar transport system substrate-binding protein
VPPNRATDPGLADAVVVLAGTGRHRQESGLEAVPAIGRTLADLKRVLIARCEVARDNVTVVDPADPAALGDALEDAVQRASGPLVFYFAGHGLVSEDGRLHLATRRTVVGRDYTALPYDVVRRRLRDSRSPLRIVVLDCCFAGRAIDVLGPADEAAAVADIDGVVVLASAGREELALAPAGAAHTIFSGALIKLLTEGDPDGPELFTLDSVVRFLRAAMKRAGYPAPRYARTGQVGELTLTTNPLRQPTPAAPARPEPPAVTSRAGRWQVAVGLVGALGMVLAMLSGAGPGATGPDPLVIMARDGDVDHKLIALWNASHDQQVRVLGVPGGREDAYQRMVGLVQSGAQAVDVYQLDVTDTAEFAEEEHLIPLPGPPPDLEGFLQNPLRTCRYGGQLWALPFSTDAGLLYYRTDLVKKVPDSLDGISAETARVAAAPVAGRAGVEAGYVGQLGEGERRTVNALEAVWAAGGVGLTEDGRIDLRSAEARAGLSWLLRESRGPAMPVVLPGAMTADEGEATRAFVSGRTLFMRNWSVPGRDLGAHPVRVERLPGPSVLGGQNLVVARTSTRPLEARELIDFLTSSAVAGVMFERRSGVTARVEAYAARETHRLHPQAGTVRAAIEEARLRPVTPRYRLVSEVFGEFVRRLSTGHGPVTEAEVRRLEAALRVR